MVKVVENKTGADTKKFLITIPKSIVELKGIKKGDKINFKLEGDRIYLDFEK